MYSLRPYGHDDAEAVLAIWWDSWHSIQPGLHHPEPLSSWRARWLADIVPTQTIVVVADERRVLVGFAAANVRSSELTQIFVAPARKRLGIGRLLLEWAQGQMPSGFTLQTLTRNAASRNFYCQQGLLEGGTQTNPFNGMETIEYRWAPLRMS